MPCENSIAPGTLQQSCCNRYRIPDCQAFRNAMEAILGLRPGFYDGLCRRDFLILLRLGLRVAVGEMHERERDKREREREQRRLAERRRVA